MINNEDYLHDISQDKPCGVYLKYDRVYDNIREAKREEDPRLPQGVWQTDIKKANWKVVIDLCTDVLKNKSKDLQIAAWLIEGYTSLQYWEGLYDGINLFCALCEKYWDNIYPELEVGDFDFRLAPIVSLTTRLDDLILLIPITNPEDNIHEAYSLSSWIEARYYAKSSGNSTFNELNESLALTQDMFLINNEHWIQKIIACIERLNLFLNSKTDNQSPSFSHMLANIKDAHTIISKEINVRELQKWEADKDTYNVIPKEAPTEVDTTDDMEEPEAPSMSTGADPFEKATLTQAFSALYQISNFIEQKDPQNPVSALIRVALYLHNKPFAELIGMTTKDGEPIMTCLSKLCSILEKKKFDKSIFDEETEQVKQP